MSSPILRLLDFTKAFMVETDASNGGIGAVLMQEEQPLAYNSKGLSIRNQMKSVYEKELMAILFVVSKWRHYLEVTSFVIRTDQKSLKFLLDQWVTSMAQQKVVVKLMGLHYTIQYKKEADNRVADALSRRMETKQEARLYAVTTTVTPAWLLEVLRSYE